MNRFLPIADGVVILRVSGVYRELTAYRRGRDVFAPYGSGFVKLNPGCATSVRRIAWLDIQGTGITLADGGRPHYEESSNVA